MKKFKFHFIYKTTCLITGKFYVGMHSTNDANDSYLGSGFHIINSIKKHGKAAHKREIIEYCADRHTLCRREREIVNENLINDNLCMNLITGGTGGVLGRPDSVLSGLKRYAEQVKNDPIIRARHSKIVSNAGKIGGAKGAAKRMERMKNDPDFALQVRAKMSTAAKEAWQKRKRRLACPS